MEYLNSINDQLRSIDDSNYEYINIFENPQFIFGNVDFSNDNTNFCKMPKIVREESKKYGKVTIQEVNNLYNSPCGNRLRFFTDSPRVIFKIKFKRKWGYQKMVNWNALGFDVYNVIGDEYKHRTVFAPMDGKDMFAEVIKTPENGCICIFLPSYNVIEELLIGIENGSKFNELRYPDGKRLPIVFYGNSITQGAAASRSGNAFPNVVSRKLNQDIINLSVSSGCRGSKYMADLIGKINCSAIVIDYTRNAYTINEFKGNYDNFYRRIRSFHPFKKIILMTSSNFNNWHNYDDFDNVVIETYKNALLRGENTELIYQKKLFKEEEFDFVTIDGSHFTDYGMFRIADEIIHLLSIDSNNYPLYKQNIFNIPLDKINQIDELSKENKILKRELKQSNELIKSHQEILNSIILDHELQASGTLKQIQELCKSLLDFIVNICDKYGLQYWLEAGALIGAIRHGNFIPWDDDIDIGMCRRDFNKLLEVLPKEIENHGLENIISLRIDEAAAKTWVMSFLQIAVYPQVHRYLAQVDVFPFDFIDECTDETIRLFEEEKRDFHVRLMKGIPRKSAEEIYFKKLNLSYEYQKTLIPGVECYRSKRDVFDFVPLDSDKMFPLKKQKFSDRYYNCPNDHDYYLKTVWGNYFELPRLIQTHNIASVMKKFPDINELYQKCIDLMDDVNKNF